MIPVMDLSLGKYGVEIIQMPMKDEYGTGKELEVNTEWQEQVISKPFSFTIEQEQ